MTFQWKCGWMCGILGTKGVQFLANLFNRLLRGEKMSNEWRNLLVLLYKGKGDRLLRGEKMPNEWRRNLLVLLYKGKGDVKECKNYRGIKLMSHTMKLRERVINSRIRNEVTIAEQQFGFMPGRTTDAIFCLRMLMEKWSEGQKSKHCVFIDLEKAYDRIPREGMWNACG